MKRAFALWFALIAIGAFGKVGAIDLRLEKYFKGYSNSAKVYWVADDVIAVSGSDTGSAQEIHLINIDTDRVKILKVENFDGKDHWFTNLIPSFDDGVFLVEEVVWEGVGKRSGKIPYVVDATTGRMTNLETEKEKVLANPKEYFKEFRYYYSEEYISEKRNYFYDFYQHDNYLLKRDRLFRVSPEEWLNAEFTESPVLRDYDKSRGVVLFKYGSENPFDWGEFYVGTFDGTTFSNLRATGIQSSGDGRLVQGEWIIKPGDISDEEFYTLVLESFDGKTVKTIPSMNVLTYANSIAVNHRTGKIAVSGLHKNIDNNVVCIYEVINE